MYCKWKQLKQERVVVPDIRINDQLEQPQRQMHQGNLNTARNNKVLVEGKHLLCLLFFLQTNTMLRYCRSSIDVLDSTTWMEASTIGLYLLDFTDKLLILFVYPLMFYMSHKELRNYWWNCFKISN